MKQIGLGTEQKQQTDRTWIKKQNKIDGNWNKTIKQKQNRQNLDLEQNNDLEQNDLEQK